VTSAERWARAQEIFHDALARHPDERATFVRATCGNDPALCEEVLSLLNAHERAATFLERHDVAHFPSAALLTPGTRVGPYEIISHLASGGMGDVYRGRDTRLNRWVAIKVLAGATGAPDASLRFDRELRAVAGLSHPHICAVHDVGVVPPSADGAAARPFLVMELLEGETLASRLRTGLLPIDEALEYATQMLDALGHAHRAGLVHRDIKPQNVFLTSSGVKLLDFGLVRSIAPADPRGDVTVSGLTAPHQIVGTPAYMPPEQIEGRPVDGRTDLFAFGVVLYEMLGGRRPFEGDSAARVFAAVLERRPAPLVALRGEISPLLARVVERCLEKRPDDRWQTAEDLNRELRWAADAPEPVSVWTRRRARFGVAIAFIAGAAIAGTAAVMFKPHPAQLAVHAAVPLPTGLRLAGSNPIAVAPDGRRFACVLAASGRPSQLYVRALDADTLKALPGTEGAVEPFWSPDSGALGFFAGGRLMRLDLQTLASSVLADDATGGGGSWSSAGSIVFARRFGASALWTIPVVGGTATPFTRLEPTDTNHLWPRFLPDGRRVLYHVLGRETGDPTGIFVSDLAGGPRRALVHSPPETSDTRPDFPLRGYLASGRLIVLQKDVAVAHAFNSERLEVSGEPVRIVDRVGRHVIGPADFDVSESLLVYSPVRDPVLRQLVWTDRRGRQLTPVGTPAPYADLALSADGRHLLVQQDDGLSRTLRRVDLQLGTSTPLALTTDDMAPVWSPDGQRFVFGSARRGPPALYERGVDDARTERRLTPTGNVNLPTGWSKTPSLVLYEITEGGQRDVWALDPERSEARHPVLQSPNDESDARLSPDGRWIAYVSNASGRPELYLAPFPSLRPQLRISADGGTRPRWRADGNELFFMSADGHLMSAMLTGGPVPVAKAPLRMFSLPSGANVYEVSPDGQRVLVITTVRVPEPPPLRIISHWAATLPR
jgi:Tol biopolymer transport system component